MHFLAKHTWWSGGVCPLYSTHQSIAPRFTPRVSISAMYCTSQAIALIAPTTQIRVSIVTNCTSALQGIKQRPERLHQRRPLHDVPAEEQVPIPGLRLSGTD